jgi:pimeloyl-ACP methyl ester carboxylesterase
MSKICTADGVNLYVETVGSGTPVVFVHEYAGDYRSWEPQVRYFCRQHRCVTYSQRGYPPSDVPSDPARYSQEIARDDVIAVMDALGIEKAHVVGHSMAATPRCTSASATRDAAYRWPPPVAAGVRRRTLPLARQ